MVFFTPKPRRVLAACCRVEVINGALGLVVVGRSLTSAILYSPAFKSAIARSVCSLLVGRKVLPSSFLTSNLTASLPLVFKSANRSQYSSGMKALMDRSRSTTKRSATDCTRPADKPLAIFAHSKGETI